MGTEGIGEGTPLHVYGESCEGRDASYGNEGSCEGGTPKGAGRGGSVPAWQWGLAGVHGTKGAWNCGGSIEALWELHRSTVGALEQSAASFLLV